MMKVGWRPEYRWLECRRQMCPEALRRSFRIVVVRGGSPVRIRIDAFVT